MCSTLRIYCDTEFTNFIAPECISIGMVTDVGHEFYAENLDFNRNFASSFVRDNIYPLLNHKQYGLNYETLSTNIFKWINELDCKNVVYTFDYADDFEILNLLLPAHPKTWKAENVYHIFNQHSKMYKEANYLLISKFFQEQYYDFLEKGKQHHALVDAKAGMKALLGTAEKFNIAL